MPELSVLAPSTPAPMTIDLNATPVGGASSSGGARKRPREMPADMPPDARNLFDRMPAAGDDETANRFIVENIIFKGGAASASTCVGRWQMRQHELCGGFLGGRHCLQAAGMAPT